ncbi:MAG: hypothetical protein U0793_09170 [Gemmataceae bacterium]
MANETVSIRRVKKGDILNYRASDCSFSREWRAGAMAPSSYTGADVFIAELTADGASA